MKILLAAMLAAGLGLAALADETAVPVRPVDAVVEPAPAVDAPDAITIPRLLSYQGRLTDTLGIPVPNGTYSVVFRLYSQPSGGSSFWNETQNVTTKDGLFSVLLGAVTPVGSMPDAGAAYLTMAVGGGAELAPRLRLASSAYAYLAERAANADLLQGRDTTAFVRTGQANSVTSAMIVDANITAPKLNQMGATTGQVLKWTGSAWAPRNDSIGGGGTMPDSVPGSFAVTTDLRVYGKGRIGNNTNAGTAAFAAGSGNSAVGNYSSTTGGTVNSAGSYAFIGGGSENVANDSFSAVAGGFGNDADAYGFIGAGQGNQTLASHAVVGGGLSNTGGGLRSGVLAGNSNNATGGGSFIGAGERNRASGTNTSIAGGENNLASGAYSVAAGRADSATAIYSAALSGYRNRAVDTAAVVCGGDSNYARGAYSVVVGGRRNVVNAPSAFIGGGRVNFAESSYSVVCGGTNNYASGNYAFVGNGILNRASGLLANVVGGQNNEAGATVSTVGGGYNNNASGYTGTIAGGRNNTALDSCAAVGGGMSNSARRYAAVGGGRQNVATGDYAAVPGGWLNRAAGAYSVAAGRSDSALAIYSGALSGYRNLALDTAAVVCGGDSNTAYSSYSTVAGGRSHLALGRYSTVAGGLRNTASGVCATVPGGERNHAAGSHSLAAGRWARANHRGSFVWSDSSATDSESVYTTAANQFRVRARGGTWFFSNAGQTTGAYLAAGSNSWASACDSANKTDFRDVDRRELLEKLAALRVREYRMRDQHDGTRHIGPVAQDFAAAFGMGENDKSINMADMDGVTIAAIQALYEDNRALRAELEALKAALERGR
jgi:hypothetical protein